MLEDVRKNVTQLISLYEGEKKRADDMSVRLSESLREVEDCKKQIAELNRQIDNQRLKSAFSASEGDFEAKRRLTRLIADIDKCIALLEA
jgi:flagellar biosynthesis chaperone FliJ